MRLVLESDRTEIGEEFLPFLETSITLLLLKSSESGKSSNVPVCIITLSFYCVMKNPTV